LRSVLFVFLLRLQKPVAKRCVNEHFLGISQPAMRFMALCF